MINVGDKVRVTNPCERYYDEVGTIKSNDGDCEGRYPWHVGFDDGTFDVYNFDDLELADESAPADDTKSTDFITVDDNDGIVTHFDNYEGAFEEAERATTGLNETVRVYKLVAEFEVTTKAKTYS